MSRLRRIADRDRIFFVTTNLAKGAASFSPEERDVLLTILDTLRTSHDFLVLGYVIMPDHAHLLVVCGTQTISVLMHQWKFKTGHAIQKRRGKQGSLCKRAISISFAGTVATFPINFVTSMRTQQWLGWCHPMPSGGGPALPPI